MQIRIQNNLSFGKSRKSEYTAHQIKIMKDMKKAAINNNWCDIYTGEAFSSQNIPTIEHVIPHSLRNSSAIKQLMQEQEFQINGLDNIFPVGSLGNSDRKSEAIRKTISDKPIILSRLLKEMEKYRTYNSDFINGQNWVIRLNETLLKELSGIYSDIKTKKIIIG